MMKIYYVFFLVCLASYISCQSITTGSCPTNTPAKTGFDVKKFSGKWKVLKQYPLLFEVTPKCNRHVYLSDKTNFVLFAKYVSSGDVPLKWAANGTFISGSNVADIKFGFIPPATINLRVLETDYNNYAVVYSCTNLLGGLSNSAFLFILSRKFADTNAALASANTVLTTYSIPTGSLVTVQQSNCPLYWKF